MNLLVWLPAMFILGFAAMGEWARRMKADPEKIRQVTASILEQNTSAPLAGWAGDRIVNVITANWMLYRHFVDVADE